MTPALPKTQFWAWGVGGRNQGGRKCWLYLDDLASIHVHQLLEVPTEQAGLGAPLEQPQQVHWAGERGTEHSLSHPSVTNPLLPQQEQPEPPPTTSETP